MNHFIITGCCGFIGSSMVDRLLGLGHRITGIDNLSTGQYRFIGNALQNSNFEFIELDLLNLEQLKVAFKPANAIMHFAANADVRYGFNHPARDLEQNTIATFNVLEAMRTNGIKNIVFSSTGSVYGEAREIPTPEDAGFPVQTSLYGASKAAGEGLISAYCEGFGFQSWIFRFVSILGERYTHGHVFDFYQKLKIDPTTLGVLGDGRQRKSYLYVQDCIDAILIAMDKAQGKVNVFNLGVDDYCDVKESIGWICESLKVAPTLTFAGGERGWVGDSPFIYLDTKRIQSLGWMPKYTIKEGVLKTLQYLKQNEWVFEARK